MLASDVFRGSPQLAAFLRYVIEATLRGEADRIKGYTIAVEALGRDSAFDPQTDPIVRVEAARLRRAISRYYASAAGPETLLIELPRGSYVPVFRRATAPSRFGHRARLSAAGIGWSHVAIGAALVLSGAAIYAALDFRFDFNTPSQPTPAGIVTSSIPAQETGRRQQVLPVVVVEPFEPVTARATTAPLARALHDRLRDALARFDEIQVTAERAKTGGDRDPPGTLQASYRVGGRLGTYDDGTLTLRVRLTDAADGSVAYTRSFDRVVWAADPSATEDAIVRELSAVLAQPYGIIHANERSKPASGARDARYRCLMQAYDYWRDYDPALHTRARDCLERAIEVDPTFAIGFAALAPLMVEDYLDGVTVRPQDSPPLQSALQDVRRAVELKPASARAHQALLVARVLAAAGRNDKEQSGRLIDRLTALQPGWRSDPRQELRKLIPTESIVERLAADLARAGLGAVN